MVSAWVMEAAQWSPVMEKKFKAAIASVYSRPQLQNLSTALEIQPQRPYVLRVVGGVVSI